MRNVQIIEFDATQTIRGYAAMRELRTHLTGPDAFVRQVDEAQRPEGYRLIGACEEPDGDAVAVAGFRPGHNLIWGHYLYVDDLSTLPRARGLGYASALLTWVDAEADRLGCDQVHLDSGTDRHPAHRVYLRNRYDITAFHFGKHR